MRNTSGISNPNYRHGGFVKYKPEYNSWRAMIARCNDPKYVYYSRYGGRGIKVCDRWQGVDGFVNFLEDMGQKPKASYSIDRIDNDGAYTPENCRWVSQKTQVRNSSHTKMVTINGKTDTVTGHIETSDVSLSTFYARTRNGWSVEDALAIPGAKTRRAYLDKVKEQTIKKLSDCLWCGNKVPMKVNGTKRKYCNGRHYMLARMNPGATEATYSGK